jgi:O-acetyl-ADP-ribose deacetylase (regulator of RNase III)
MRFVTGNLLESTTEALVNTVNTVGVMGKGIALQFKEKFPINNKIYVSACKSGEMIIGKMLVVKDHTTDGAKLIINFPTKTEWFKKSQYEFIEEGLKDLVRVIREYNITSISIPPLGCGNGGLKWDKVKALMEKYLGDLSHVDIQVFEPNDAVKVLLQNENQKRDVELRPGRAMLLYDFFKYERLGEIATTFAANKLAYFLQRSGEPMKLKFVPYTYGPYAQAVEKVLYSLNGKYLNGIEQMKAKAFEPLKLNYQRYSEVEEYIHKNLNDQQKQRLDQLFDVIEGFESTMSLEILASIDYLLSQDNKLSTDDLLSKIKSWNERKKELINKEHIEIALLHLKDYSNKLNFN